MSDRNLTMARPVSASTRAFSAFGGWLASHPEAVIVLLLAAVLMMPWVTGTAAIPGADTDTQAGYSGYGIGQFATLGLFGQETDRVAASYLYIIFLVPILAALTLWQSIQGRGRASRWLAALAGVIPLVVLGMLRQRFGGDVLSYATPGLWLSVALGVLLMIWPPVHMALPATRRQATATRREAARYREPSVLRQMFRSRMAYVYILPATIVMAVITLYPILYGIWMSFTDYRAKNLRLNNPPWAGLDNFVRVFDGNLPVATIQNYDFWRLLLFNFVWAVTNVFFHVAIGIGVAMLLNRKRLFGRRFYRAIFIIPWALPAFVSALIWRFMFNTQFGPINELLGGAQIPWLESSGSDIFPVPFLTFLPLAFYAVLITNVWLGWPFMSVVATGALQSVPGELYEAAEVDGATKWQQFWNITVPSIRPAMIPAVMLGFIWTFNQFNVIYFISQGGPYGATEILVTQAFKLVNPGRLYGLASAFSIVVFFVLLVITLINNKVTKATEGGYA